jgi:hypothetical protein
MAIAGHSLGTSVHLMLAVIFDGSLLSYKWVYLGPQDVLRLGNLSGAIHRKDPAYSNRAVNLRRRKHGNLGEMPSGPFTSSNYVEMSIFGGDTKQKFSSKGAAVRGSPDVPRTTLGIGQSLAKGKQAMRTENRWN